MSVTFLKEFQIQQTFKKFFQEASNLESIFVKNREFNSSQFSKNIFLS